MSLVPHRSISQINKYSGCARKYRFSYIDKIPEEGSIHFAIGSSIDDALTDIINNYDFENIFERFAKFDAAELEAAANVHQLIEKELIDTDPKLTNLINDALEKYLNPDILDLTEEEAAQFTEDDIHFLRDCQLHFSKLLKPYLSYLISRGLMPLSSQHKIDYGIDGIDARLTGYIDMIAKDYYTNNIVIVDFKTSKRRLSSVKLEHKYQVWAYAKAIEEEYNLSYLPRCEVHYFSKLPPALPRAKKKDNHVNGVAFDPDALKNLTVHEYPEELIQAMYSGQQLEDLVDCFDAHFDRADWDNMLEILFDMEHSFAHNFWPRNRNNPFCSPKGCSYWDICVGATESRDSLAERKSIHLRAKTVQKKNTEFVVASEKPASSPQLLKPKPPPALMNAPKEVTDFNDFLIN